MLQKSVSAFLLLQSCWQLELILPPDVVVAPSLQAFKNRLDSIWSDRIFFLSHPCSNLRVWKSRKHRPRLATTRLKSLFSLSVPVWLSYHSKIWVSYHINLIIMSYQHQAGSESLHISRTGRHVSKMPRCKAFGCYNDKNECDRSKEEFLASPESMKVYQRE